MASNLITNNVVYQPANCTFSRALIFAASIKMSS